MWEKSGNPRRSAKEARTNKPLYLGSRAGIHRMLAALALSVFVCLATAWPGMKSKTTASGPKIGPVCTVGAHGWWPDAGPCPNMKQPSAPNGKFLTGSWQLSSQSFFTRLFLCPQILVDHFLFLSVFCFLASIKV